MVQLIVEIVVEFIGTVLLHRGPPWATKLVLFAMMWGLFALIAVSIVAIAGFETNVSGTTGYALAALAIPAYVLAGWMVARRPPQAPPE